MKTSWNDDTLTCKFSKSELRRYGLTLETFALNTEAIKPVLGQCVKVFAKTRKECGLEVEVACSDSEAFVRLTPLSANIGLGQLAEMFGMPAGMPPMPEPLSVAPSDFLGGVLARIFGASTEPCNCPECQKARARRSKTASMMAFKTLDDIFMACKAATSCNEKVSVYKYDGVYYALLDGTIPYNFYNFGDKTDLWPEQAVEHGELVCTTLTSALAVLA